MIDLVRLHCRSRLLTSRIGIAKALRDAYLELPAFLIGTHWLAMDVTTQFALAFVAGALLNLTPCVLPVIPVKIRTILRHAGSSPKNRSQAAVAFLAGTLLFFLLVGSASAMLHWTWGAAFQSRIVLVVLVAVLTGAGIMVFVDAPVPVPRVVHRVGGGRHFEPFSSGALAAVLATPCTGPFLGGVLAFAVTQPPIVVVGIFASIGLGLAGPYVIVLLRPDLLGHLPKSGEWSERLREGLAFLLLAGAVFFAQSLLPSSFAPWLWRIWAGLVVVWASIAVLRAHSLGPRIVALGLAAIFLAGAYAGGLTGTTNAAGLEWQQFSPARLAEARSTRHPVLVEFTADWCINCKVLEKTVYADSAVVKAARTSGLVPLRVDLTSPDAKLERLMLGYGGAGLPFAVVIDGRGTVIKRFSGLFSVDSLISSIDRTRNSRLGPGKA